MILLVPGDPLRPHRPDEHFEPEARAAREAGLDVAVINHDALVRPGGAEQAVVRVRGDVHKRSAGFRVMSYASYALQVTELQWRMPGPSEPPARLAGVSLAEVAEALEAPLHDQLRQRIDKDVIVVYSVTAEHRTIGVLLVRYDDSFVWRVAQAKPTSAREFEAWLERTQR